MAETVVYHVVPSGDVWAVKKQGSEHASRVAETQKQALDHARTFARNQAPARIILHGDDGAIESQIVVEGAPGWSGRLTSAPVLTGVALAVIATAGIWCLADRD